jgi:hypothetical protein
MRNQEKIEDLKKQISILEDEEYDLNFSKYQYLINKYYKVNIGYLCLIYIISVDYVFQDGFEININCKKCSFEKTNFSINLHSIISVIPSEELIEITQEEFHKTIDEKILTYKTFL